MESIFACKVCQEHYNLNKKKPLFLPCGHTFCEECLTKIWEDEIIKCPFDKKAHNYEDISSIVVNQAIIDAISSEPKQKKMCTLHPKEELKFYCQTHCIYICQECLLKEHLGHLIIAAEDVIDVNELKNHLNILKEKYLVGEKTLAEFKNEISEEFELGEKQLTSSKNVLVKSMERQLEEYAKDAKNKFIEFSTSIDNQKNKIEEINKNLDNFNTFFEKPLENEEKIKEAKSYLKINSEWEPKLHRGGFYFDDLILLKKEFFEKILQDQNPDVDVEYLQLLTALKGKVIKSENVFQTLAKVDRKNFVAENQMHRRYIDVPLSIGWNTTISAPHMHAHTLEYLKNHLRKGGNAVDIGCGSGFLTVCMATMIKNGKVYGIDHINEIITFALNNVKKSHGHLLSNGTINFITADGRKGLAEHAPYNVIHVGGALAQIPNELEEQLAHGGRMWIPVGPFGAQAIYVVDKDENGVCTTQKLFRVAYGLLTSAENQVNANF